MSLFITTAIFQDQHTPDHTLDTLKNQMPAKNQRHTEHLGIPSYLIPSTYLGSTTIPIFQISKWVQERLKNPPQTIQEAHTEFMAPASLLTKKSPLSSLDPFLSKKTPLPLTTRAPFLPYIANFRERAFSGHRFI